MKALKEIYISPQHISAYDLNKNWVVIAFEFEIRIEQRETKKQVTKKVFEEKVIGIHLIEESKCVMLVIGEKGAVKLVKLNKTWTLKEIDSLCFKPRISFVKYRFVDYGCKDKPKELPLFVNDSEKDGVCIKKIVTDGNKIKLKDYALYSEKTNLNYIIAAKLIALKNDFIFIYLNDENCITAITKDNSHTTQFKERDSPFDIDILPVNSKDCGIALRILLRSADHIYISTFDLNKGSFTDFNLVSTEFDFKQNKPSVVALRELGLLCIVSNKEFRLLDSEMNVIRSDTMESIISNHCTNNTVFQYHRDHLLLNRQTSLILIKLSDIMNN